MEVVMDDEELKRRLEEVVTLNNGAKMKTSDVLITHGALQHLLESHPKHLKLLRELAQGRDLGRWPRLSFHAPP